MNDYYNSVRRILESPSIQYNALPVVVYYSPYSLTNSDFPFVRIIPDPKVKE